jgi:chaperonin GroES
MSYILGEKLALSPWECQKEAAPRRIRSGPPVAFSETEVFKMKLKPLGDRLIVRAIEEEETTASGIVLPDTAKEKPQKGKVLAVGDDKLDDDGKRVPLDVKKNDEVLYSKYGGTEIKVDGEDLLVLRESDVLARVES